jgi:two-component system CheB/CheR fusion protein
VKVLARDMAARHDRARSLGGMANERHPPEMEIVQIVKLLASCDAVEDVVRVLASAARSHVGADGVTVVMRDGDRSRYLEENAIGALWKGRDFPLDECISGWAMQRNLQVVVPDIRDDPRIPLPLYQATFVRSLVMTPIECAGEVVGALGAYWSQARTPSAVECETLQAIASSAALALVNVRLLADIRQDVHRKERFLDGLANELGALVGPLRTSLHTQRHSKDAEALRRAGEVITRQLADHARLIDHLRDGSTLLSGKDSLSFWPIDLADPIARAIDARRQDAARAEIEIAFRPPSTPLPVLGDERRLAQALGHLLDNSLRFTPPGGRISVHAEVVGPCVVAQVEDTGVGISADVLPHLFEPFYRPEQEPENSAAGLGLGLGLVAQIARLHGGEARVRSAGAGKGTSVMLRIPLLDLREDASNHGARREAASSG